MKAGVPKPLVGILTQRRADVKILLFPGRNALSHISVKHLFGAFPEPFDVCSVYHSQIITRMDVLRLGWSQLWGIEDFVGEGTVEDYFVFSKICAFGVETGELFQAAIDIVYYQSLFVLNFG